ncbi:MAG: carboxypeptidase regulatory-like domain-containing protein, partial [Deltaproteobacteria bacterium]|nr:carboxypeptidase regulatory-like domain-containing protein [Deltaproteobacteria bacterium]
MKLRLFAVMAIGAGLALIAAGVGVGDDSPIVTDVEFASSLRTSGDYELFPDLINWHGDVFTPEISLPLALGDVQGIAVNAQTGQAISGVDVELFEDDGTPVDSTTTAANGTFSFPALQDLDYYITLNTPGFMETKIWTRAPADAVTQLPEGKMVREPVVLHGTAAGFIRNALTGGPLNGVDLEFRRGINAPTSEPVLYTARTTFTGRYIVNNMRAGVYTARAAATTNMCESNIVVWTQGAETIDNQNAALSQALLEGQMRIVLTWGATPSDLDSHLWAPHYGCNAQNPYHLYFAARQCGVIVNLDVDDTTSFGPETTTVGVSQDPVIGQTYSFL